MTRRRLFLFGLFVAALLLPVMVQAEPVDPAVLSVTSATDYKSVDVTFTENAFTTTTAGVGTGDLVTDDFTVVTKAGAGVAFTVTRRSTGTDLTAWTLTFTNGAITPHDVVISTVAGQIYTGAGAAFPATATDAPFNSGDLDRFLAGLKNVPVVPAVPAVRPDPVPDDALEKLPFVSKWFGAEQSLAQMITGLPDLTAGGTEAQLISALKGTGFVSDVTFAGTKATIHLDPAKVSSTKTIPVEAGAEEIGGKTYDLSVKGDVSVTAGLGGSVSLDVTGGSVSLDTASAPQLVLKSTTTFSPAGRLGVVSMSAPASTFNLNAALTATLACPDGETCTAIGDYEPTLAPGGNADLSIKQVDVKFGDVTKSFQRTDSTTEPLLKLTWADLAETDEVTAAPDMLTELKLRDFTRVSVDEIAGGLQWIATWLTELENHGSMTEELPIVGGSIGDAAGLSRSLADPAIMLAQVLGAVEDVSAQELPTICVPATSGPIITAMVNAAPVDSSLTAAEQAAAKTKLTADLTEAAALCAKMLKGIAYDETANAIKYTIGFEVEEDIFNGVAPTMNLGLDDLQGIQVTGRSGAWTGNAKVKFNMTFGVKLGDAQSLGIAGGVATGDYDGDGILDTEDEDDDGDGAPESHTLVAGERCEALAGLLNLDPKALRGESGIDACDAKLKTGTVISATDPATTLTDKHVCQAVANLFGVEPDAFRTMNSSLGSTDASCATAVQSGGSNGPYVWDNVKELAARAQLPHRLYIGAGTAVAEAGLDITGTGVGASAKLGILDLDVNGSVSLKPKATFGFVDPAGTTEKTDGKIDLFEFAQKADAATKADDPKILAELVSMTFSGAVDTHLAVSNTVLFGSTPRWIDIVGDLSALDNVEDKTDPDTGDVVIDPLTGEPEKVRTIFEFHSERVTTATGETADRIHVGHDLADALNLKDITPAQAIQMIVGIVEQLAAMGDAGVMSQTIPFIDVTPAQMVDFSKDFADVAARVQARDPQDLTTLNAALAEALGSVGMPTNLITVAVTATELTVTFDASQSITRTYPFSFQGAGPAFAPADGGASIEAIAAVAFKPTVGITFDAGATPTAMADRLFVRNITPKFDVALDAQVFGSVYLGPLSASLTGTAKVGDTTAGTHELTLAVKDVADTANLTLTDLKSKLANPSSSFTLAASGPVTANIDISAVLPTGGRGTGTLNITGNLNDPAAIKLAKPVLGFDLGLDVGTFVNGSIQTARFVGRSLEQSEAVSSDIPLVGNDLKSLVTVGADIRKGADELEKLWNAQNGQTNGRNNFTQLAEGKLDAVLCPGETCTTMTLYKSGGATTEDMGEATAMELGLKLGKSATKAVTLDEGLALEPVFDMSLSMSPQVTYGYELDVVLGMSITEGFYVKASQDGGDVVQLFASMSTGSFGAKVDLLGLAADITKGTASISGGLGPVGDKRHGGFAIKVGGTDGKLTMREISNRRTQVDSLIAARFDIDVKADLPLTVDAVGVAQLAVPINFRMQSTQDVAQLTAPEPMLAIGCDPDVMAALCTTEERVELDITTLVDKVFKPVFGDQFLGNKTYNPLANPDIKAALETEIPVLDTTLRKLLEETAKATGKENEFKALTMLIDISTVDINAMSGKIDLGWAKVTPGWQYYGPDVAIKDQDTVKPLYALVDSIRGKGGSTTTAASTEAVTTANSAANKPGTGVAPSTRQPSATRPGTGVRDLTKMISFPIINDPAAAMNLLRGDVGESVDFLRIEPPPINIGPSINWSRTLFDLDIGFMKGGLTVAFQGNLGLSMNLGFGFDSSGIAQGEAWKGLYIVDYPGYEISLGGSVAGSIDGYFSVAGGIADVRFRGSAGVSLLAGIDLFDDSIALPTYSRSDGKMTVGEMVMFDDAYGNPLCMFKLGISLKANLGFSGKAKVLGITVFNESYSDSWTLVDEVLTCQIRTRVAHMEGRRLILNGGTFADFRYDGEGDVREDFVLTKDGDNIVVDLKTKGSSSGKPPLRFPISGIDEIYAELGGSQNSVDISDAITLPSTIFGGPNVDTLTGGGGVDTFDGGAGNDVLGGRSGADILSGGDGNDTLEGGAGDDETAGGDGTNTYLYGDAWNTDVLDDAGADATLTFTGNNALTGVAEFDEGTITATNGSVKYDLETVSKVLGGNGADTFTFNRYSPEGFLFNGRNGADHATFKSSGIERTVKVTDTGGGTGDKLTVLGTLGDDTFLLRANGTGTGPATSGFVAMKTPTELVDRVNYDNTLENFNLDGVGGDNSFVLDDTATKLTLDAGDGDNKFQVGQIFANARSGANVISGGEFRTREVHARGHLSYGISHDATINGGDGVDFFTVYSNTAPLNLNGGDGDDTFVVRAFIAEGTVTAAGGDGNDKFDYIQNKLVTIDGGGGFNTFIAVGTELTDGWHVTKDGLKICDLEAAPSGTPASVPRLPGTTDCGINVAYTNIQSLVAHGLQGNDVFWIQSTDTGVHTQLFGGVDGATFYASHADNGVNDVEGPLTVVGDFDPEFDATVAEPVTLPGEDATPGDEPTPGTYVNQDDKLIVNAAKHTNADTGNLTSSRLSGLGMGAGETIAVETAEGSRSFPTGIIYEQIDVLETQLGTAADTFKIDSTHTYETGGNDSETIATDTTILGGPAADDFRVRTIDGPTTIKGEADDDIVRAGTLAPDGNGRINLLADLLTVKGGAGTADALYVDDTGATGATTSVVTDATIRKLNMAKGIDYDGLEVLDLDLGSGADVVNMRGTSAVTTVHGNTGDEDFYVASAADLTTAAPVTGLVPHQIENNLLAGHAGNVAGALTLDAGAGNHLLMVSDRAATAGDSAVAMTSNTITGLAPASITYNADGTYKRGITVWSSNEADTVGVTSTRNDAGVRTGTTLNTGAGGDVVTATLAATGNGPFVTNLQGGNDTFTGSASALGLTVFGGNGVDDISTGTGEDQVFGDKALATYGDALTVVGHGGTGDHTDGAVAALSALTSTDVCVGGNDTVNLGTGNDVAYGGAGDDALRGEVGNDHLLGDNGQHEATWTAPLHLSLDAGSDACFGNDTLLGGAGDDSMMGQGGTDTVYGNGIVGNLTNDDALGTNVIIGGHDVQGGLDTDDVLIGGGAVDSIIGDNGTVSDTGLVMVHDLGCGGDCGDVAGNDILRGQGGTNRLFGGVGDDYVVGGAGFDRMEGGPHDDWLEGGTGDDDIIGGSSFVSSGTDGYPSGDDVVFGSGNDVILGDNGQIERDGTGTTTGATMGAETFTTEDAYLTTVHRSVQLFDLGHTVDIQGDDIVAAGDGNSFVFGQGGNDWVGGGNGDDYVEGNAGNDVVTGDRKWGLTINDDGDVTSALSETMPDSFPGIPASLLTLRLADPVGETTFANLEGTTGAAGQDDLIGGSSIVGQPSGDDVVYGDGADDFAFGDNAKVTREIMAANDARRSSAPYGNITGSAYARYDERYSSTVAMPATATVVRKVVEHNVGSSTSTALAAGSEPYGDDFIDGGRGNDMVAGQDGADKLWGGPAGEPTGLKGDDHVIGGLGDDELFGGGGNDVLLGDRGSIITHYLDASGDARDPAGFSYKSKGAPFLTFDVFTSTSSVVPRGTRWNRVDLYCAATRTVEDDRSRPAFVGYGKTTCQAGGSDATDDMMSLSYSSETFGGNDVARGGPGTDAIYGGAGMDLLNGDSGADRVFGGLGDDAIWGGMGNLDLLFGGAGDDFLDYRPRVQQEFAGEDGWTSDPAIRHDDDEWFDTTAAYAHPDAPDTMVEPDPQHHQGVSWMYGGLGRDALQGSVTTTGPNEGTRMLDWSGLYNLYTQCGPDYGGYNIIRTFNSSTQNFVQAIAYAAGSSPNGAATVRGQSPGDQLGLATSKDAQTGAPYEDAHVGGTTGANYSSFIECG